MIQAAVRPTFAKFHPVTEAAVRKLVLDSPSSSCDQDPIPTWLLKKCINELTPVLTRIVNLSLLEGHFPDSFKHAQVDPLIKKSGLDPEVLANYRPIAKLKFVSKLIERAGVNQINAYLEKNRLYGKTQSAYRKHHSVETAMIRIYNDLLLAADRGQETVLVMLDYSSAFDIIDHDTMLQRLSSGYGIVGTALDWFRSYFNNRT